MAIGIQKAEFKTAYLQRAITLDAEVASFVDLSVNCLVQYVGGTHPAIVPVTTIAEATHLIAQSDMTLLKDKHPRTDMREYYYDSAVAAGLAASGVTVNTNFLGAYATNPTSGVTASNKWIFNTTDGKVYKSTYSSSTLSWAEDTSVTTTTKKLALYPIFDKADVVTA